MLQLFKTSDANVRLKLCEILESSWGGILGFDGLLQEIVLSTPKYLNKPQMIIALISKGLITVEEFDKQANSLLVKDSSLASPILDILRALAVDLKLCSIYNFPQITQSLKSVQSSRVSRPEFLRVLLLYLELPNKRNFLELKLSGAREEEAAITKTAAALFSTLNEEALSLAKKGVTELLSQKRGE